MKRPLAYITAPWSKNPHENAANAASYCRQVYDAGYSPVCPVLFLPLFLKDEIPRNTRTESTSPEITCADPMCWWSVDTRPMKRSKTILPPLNACGSPPPRWTGF